MNTQTAIKQTNELGGTKTMTDTSDNFFYDPDIPLSESQTTFVQAQFEGHASNEFWETDITIVRALGEGEVGGGEQILRVIGHPGLGSHITIFGPPQLATTCIVSCVRSRTGQPDNDFWATSTGN